MPEATAPDVLQRPPAPPNPSPPGRQEALLPSVAAAPRVSIKVVGIGGAGGNVVDCMVGARLAHVETLVVNTDRQALQGSGASTRLCLGEAITRGLGAGGDPVVGQSAAEASAAQLQGALRGADAVFLMAGMGGGTGTGAAPIIAGIARELGALTVAIVTRPFGFEGRRRAQVAEQGLAQLRSVADTVIVVPNDRLLKASARTTTVRQAFAMADTVLRYGVGGIADLITRRGLINVDFADVRTVMGEAGRALLGIGVSRGPNRSIDAMRKAMACPLLEGGLEGARRLLFNITGGEDLGLIEVQGAAELLMRRVHPDANIIFGAIIDPSLNGGYVKVTLVAAGFDESRPSDPASLPSPQARVLVRTAG